MCSDLLLCQSLLLSPSELFVKGLLSHDSVHGILISALGRSRRSLLSLASLLMLSAPLPIRLRSEIDFRRKEFSYFDDLIGLSKQSISCSGVEKPLLSTNVNAVKLQ